MDYYLRSYDECGQTATPDIAPDKLALIIQQCNAFTKRVGVNPNLAAPSRFRKVPLDKPNGTFLS